MNDAMSHPVPVPPPGFPLAFISGWWRRRRRRGSMKKEYSKFQSESDGDAGKKPWYQI